MEYRVSGVCMQSYYLQVSEKKSDFIILEKSQHLLQKKNKVSK